MAFINISVVSPPRTVVNFASLGILVPLIQKLNIAAIIDRHVPADPQLEYSHGSVLSVLLAARLQQPTALVNIAGWAAEHGVEYLCNIPADKLNDDRIGRSLDAFFEHRHSILAEVTHEVLSLTDLTLDSCHFDTTHFVLYGAYESSVPRPPNLPIVNLLNDLQYAPAHITHGYLTRYKMVQFGMTSVVDDLGPIPIACHLFDGNRNGHTGVKEQYQLMRQTLKLPDNLLLVSDRGTCSAEHFATLRRHGHYGLCAGQWQDYRCVYEANAASLNWQEASYLSLEQQRRREGESKLPLENYHLAVVHHQLTDPTTDKPFDCRIVFVKSSAAAKESKERRDKNSKKIRAGLAIIACKLEKAHTSTTPESVTRQITRLLGKKSAADFFSWQLVALSEAEQAALPKPAKGYRTQTHRLVYSFAQADAEADARHDGIYALVTTAPITMSGDALFTEYKRQIYVEREHHELKTPLAVTPIFLKTPSRVEALVSLMFLALQAYMTLERLYRQTADADAKLSERHMTAERILAKFNDCCLIREQQFYGELLHTTRLTSEQRTILFRLSLATPTEILRKNLPPPPVP